MRTLASALLILALLAIPAAGQIDPSTALLEKSGWEALNAGNFRAAADAFRAAIGGDSRNARLHLGAGTAAYLERRDEDATRELVHTLASRNVPTWLNEGLAAAFEADDLDWAQARVREAPQPIPLDKLRTSFGRLSGAQAQLAYATSALAVRQLVDEVGGFGMANLLRDLGAGVDFEAAFAHRIQRSLTDWMAGGT
jgi:hypothetical protein